MLLKIIALLHQVLIYATSKSGKRPILKQKPENLELK